MKIKNEAMLITYADSLGKNMGELKQVLDKHLQGIIGGVHLLPFFHRQVIEALRRVIIRQLIQLLEHGKMWKH